jgi:uncharacterized membrane protein YesL
MNHLFDPENRFWSFLGKIFDAMFMGLLWALFSLPIVTLGASTTAFYQYTLRQVNDTEGAIWKSFISFFGKRFKKATAIWLIQLGVGAFLAYDLWLCWQMIDWSSKINVLKIVFFVLVTLAVIYLSTSIYLYPILALFDFKVKKVITNAFVMAMGNLPVTITVGLLFLLAGVGACYYPLCTPFFVGLAVFFSSFFLFRVLEKYTVEDENEQEIDNWRMEDDTK